MFLQILLPATLAFAPTTAPQDATADLVPAQVDDFRYSYTFGGPSAGAASGFRMGGSYLIDSQLFALGQYTYLGNDQTVAQIDYMSISAGAGYIHQASERLDYIGSLELEHRQVNSTDVADGKDSELGFRARVGLRHRLDSNAEMYAGASYRSAIESDYGLDGGVLYKINEEYSVFIELEYANLSQFTIGLRYHL